LVVRSQRLGAVAGTVMGEINQPLRIGRSAGVI
jgi:hypothetical protein